MTLLAMCPVFDAIDNDCDDGNYDYGNNDDIIIIMMTS